MRLLPITLVLLASSGALRAQYEPPRPTALPPETVKDIAARMSQLAKQIDVLRTQGVRDPFLADVEVYLKAARWMMGHGEFYTKDAGQATLDVLDRGLLRAAQQARGESPWIGQTGRSVVRGYRSQIDGSVQPYAVTLPKGYGEERGKRWRIDVVLHGRSNSLTEVSFLKQHDGSRAAPEDLNHVRIDVYGRGNIAYRWAGEADVLEALNSFLEVEQFLGRTAHLYLDRTVLRGFSMGGAGTWHIGLHYPDRWAVLGPGAGFTTTHGYIKNLPEKLPPQQEACLHIYDAVDYAENAFNVPVVAYSGDKDPQMQAAVNIEQRLKPLGIPMTHLVAPGLDHKFPPEWQKKAEAEYAKHAERGIPMYPERVRFVTWTTRYNTCHWVQVLGMERHYHKALVDAEITPEGYKVKTENVRQLRLRMGPGAVREPMPVEIDGQALKPVPYLSQAAELAIHLEKREGRWEAVLPERILTDRLRRPQKVNGLQGPIDDAFMSRFLCVRGTGEPWHKGTQAYADASLQRFASEWSKYLRGDLPIKDDRDVTPEDLATCNLILFGDPASNSLIAQVLPGLPLTWTSQELALAGKPAVASSEHVPVLIYPSPLNPSRYVVLNSGHTFHAEDFRGTNALLYPRLGDYAVLKVAPNANPPKEGQSDARSSEVLDVAIIHSGLFDEYWQPGK